MPHAGPQPPQRPRAEGGRSLCRARAAPRPRPPTHHGLHRGAGAQVGRKGGDRDAPILVLRRAVRGGGMWGRGGMGEEASQLLVLQHPCSPRGAAPRRAAGGGQAVARPWEHTASTRPQGRRHPPSPLISYSYHTLWDIRRDLFLVHRPEGPAHLPAQSTRTRRPS